MRKAYRAVAVAIALAVPAIARAQTPGVSPLRFGAQVDFMTDGSNLGVGARAEYGLAAMIPSMPQLRAIASFDYYFPGSGVTYWELNLNAAYQLDMPDAPVAPYVGGGLNYAHVGFSSGGFSGSSNEVGLNILGGIRLRAMGSLTPFAEAKIELGGGETVVLTFGMLLR